ncbi:hypothetical protein CEXT_698081 [Caerostris extrusa]|uniref:Uncharacterized protein n=1 Tax=Caerostris extrusa TaxID=172846 RepID=A0AAV4UKL2_CAEEX|nr:hypothetical protein CEXT_698081 [Caerostris extrusa]
MEVLFFMLNVLKKNKKKKGHSVRKKANTPLQSTALPTELDGLMEVQQRPSSRSRTSDLWIPAIHRYSPPLCQLSYRRADGSAIIHA